ncbi:MAG: nucleoside-diphosphate kinase [bacterium]|nr:nucleoside-diphosphate kinase [bacterium]
MSAETSILRDLQTPDCFSSRTEAWKTITQWRTCGLSPVSTSDRQKIVDIITALSSEEVNQMVTVGKLTIGLIKPNAHEGKDLPPTDEQAAEAILGMVGRERLAYHLHFGLGKTEAGLFYAPLREEYQDKVMPQKNHYNNFGEFCLFDTMVRFTASGPLTVLFIEGKDAVANWRETMGKTNPEQAGPNSIRGKHGLLDIMPNSLVHGSDSVESAQREKRVLTEALMRFYISTVIRPDQIPDSKPVVLPHGG